MQNEKEEEQKLVKEKFIALPKEAGWHLLLELNITSARWWTSRLDQTMNSTHAPAPPTSPQHGNSW